MLERLFGGDAFQAQTRALDASALRHQAIAHNLSNANTPNFKRQEVQFETELSRALRLVRKIRRRFRVRRSAPPYHDQLDTSGRADGNNVNLELESAKLAENAMRFEVLSQSIGGYFTGLKNVINGGK